MPFEGHGWAHGNSAVFVTALGVDDDQVGLFLQQGRDTQLAAVFTDTAMATIIMDWLDSSLEATAKANTELLERLKADQPLSFTEPRPSERDFSPEDTEDLEFPR